MVLLAVIVPFWTSYLLRVYAWQAILGERGALNQFLDGPRHHQGADRRLFVYNDLGVFVVLVYVYFPFAALALYAALEKFDFTQLNAAQDLGARPDQAFRHILRARRSGPGIITACIFVFIPILGEFLTPTLVGGAQGSLIANLVVNFFRQCPDRPRAPRFAIVIAAFVTVAADHLPAIPAGRGRGGPWLGGIDRARDDAGQPATPGRPAAALACWPASSWSSSTCRSRFLVLFSFNDAATARACRSPA